MMKSILLILTILFSTLSFSQTNNSGTQVNGSINGLIDNMSIKLFSFPVGGPKVETDGVRTKFGNNYCTCVDGSDGIKFMGSGIENISLIRDGVSLAIEARPSITTTDTSFLEMVGMSIGGSYQFFMTPTNFDTSVAVCKLIDHFLNSEIPVSLTDTTAYNFDVTAAIGSDATDRFSFIYTSTVTLPLNNLIVTAYSKNNGVIIDWASTTENNVKLYNVEKSTDGVSFHSLGNRAAINNTATNKYSFTDYTAVVGVNYYRIKTTQANDNFLYSAIAKVDVNKSDIKNITIYPNPIRSSAIGVQFNNVEVGKYVAKLFNATGKQVWANAFAINNGNGSISLQLKNSLTAGIYQLQFTNINGDSYQQKLIVVE